MAPKVLVVGEIDTDSGEYAKFATEFSVIHYPRTISRTEFIHKLRTELTDLFAIFTVWGVFLPPFGGFGGDDLLDALPPSLKVIAVSSAGVDQYDVAALRKKDIYVTNVPGLSSVPVTEIALFLTLATYRFTSVFEYTLRQTANTTESRQAVAKFDKQSGTPLLPASKLVNPPFALGDSIGEAGQVHSPRGFRAGIAGFGAIGKLIGKSLSELGMSVHYTKRTELTKDELGALTYAAEYHPSFEELAKVSDLIVLALPLSPQTKHVLNAESIKLLPRGAKVVNIGRGPLIDQKALVDALKTGQLSAAGLDVFEAEPIVEPELLSRYDVTIVPHIGTATAELLDGAFLNCMENIRAVYKNGKPLA